jgi:hypothetical protein
MLNHHPPHIYLDDAWYLITSSIYQKHHLLAPINHKMVVRDQLKSLSIELKLSLAAWVNLR